MGTLSEFYSEKCEVHENPNWVFLKTDFEKIELNTIDTTYKDIRYLVLDNLVRFLNPKVNFCNQSISTDSEILIPDDFDMVLGEIEKIEVSQQNSIHDSLSEFKPLYFVPSHIEEKIKQITCGTKRKKIDSRLKQILPEVNIKELNLQFAPGQEEYIVEYDVREKHSISFFKFYKPDTFEECTDEESIQKQVNAIKYVLNMNYVQSMDFYFIGNVNVIAGLFERNVEETNKDPLYYHFNFWKLQDIELETIFNGFKLYPFKEEAEANDLGEEIRTYIS
ncbi:hypothetical protein CN503_25745 [Bacillus cereus]|uniref:hypothetical protein n=1 Tax=Bacillus cereus TaxID=1396 RepID=UPI000B7F9BEA|nr:hypothetical protein [Bacillus cereus]PER60196.1 hypothetical protein CN503_25745 [Bacillus cereus]PFM08360.1 hypothetical protein COJ39_16665 [Bacillus cereus]